MRCWAWLTVCASKRMPMMRFGSPGAVFAGGAWRFAVAVAIWLHASAVLAVQTLEVQLHAHAVAGGAQVSLRDVADLRGVSEALVERLGALSLGPAPLVGERVQLTREQVAGYATRHWRAQALAVQWTGEHTVVIERGQQQVLAADMDAAARSALADWLTKRVDRFEIGPMLSTVAEVSVPAGALTLTVRQLGSQVVPVGRVTVWLELRVDDRLARLVPVVLQVQSFSRAWIARLDLAANSLIEHDYFEQRELALRLPYREVATALPGQARLSRGLRAGEALTTADMVALRAVNRGDMVAAQMRRGAVTVRTQGEALQDGQTGQRVLVRLSAAAAPVLAQVLEPGLVEVMR